MTKRKGELIADPATHPALHEERRRMLASRLLAVQAVPQRICNAAMPNGYRGTTWNLRPGAEDHKQFKSRTPFKD